MKTLAERREDLKARYPVWNNYTIDEMFRKAAREYAGHPFLIVDGREYTYQEISDLSANLALSLRIQGVKKGDVICVFMKNSLEAILLTFAAAEVGAAKVCINPSSTDEQIAEFMNRTGASKLIVMEADSADRKKQNRMKKITSQILILEGDSVRRMYEPDADTENACTMDDLPLPEKGREGVRSAKNRRDNKCVRPCDEVADYLFTSGSTGTPKCIALTHDMLLRAAYANCLNRGFYQGQRVYVPLPLFHVYGYVEGVLAVLFTGGVLIISSEKFSAEKAIRLIEAHRADDILSIPLHMVKILECPSLQDHDLSSLHMVYCSASTCPQWLWGAIREKLSVHEITTGYGMTETSGASMQSDPLCDDAYLQQYLGHVLDGGAAGDPALGGKVAAYKVVRPGTWEEVEPGETGELICTGLTIIREYHGAGIEEEKLFLDGWMRTSDMGSINEDGELQFIGKCNDIYKTNGENVSARYLDRIISRCPEVSQVETVGVPDEKCGWVGACFIDAYCCDRESQEKIHQFCADHLASHEIPKYFFFTLSEKWPKTSTGKVIKKALREEALRLIKEGSFRTLNREAGLA